MCHNQATAEPFHLDSSSPTIEDSTFTRNQTNTFDGGAIHINSTSQSYHYWEYFYSAMWLVSLVVQLILNHPQTQRFRTIPLALTHRADGVEQSTMRPLVSHFPSALF